MTPEPDRAADSPAALLDLATDVAQEAAALIIARIQDDHTVDNKASDLDLVTEVDRASESLITNRLLGARPDDGIVGEEGASVSGTSGVEWVIDPIDGTTSFVYGLPGFSVSIAATVDDELTVGVVVAPMIGSTYRCARGLGTTHNGRPVTCRAAPSLDKALIGTGFSPDHERRARQGVLFAELIPQIRDIRRMGSAALDLCAVAAGQLDAYFEEGLSVWDWSAGVLMVREAGGVVIAEPDPHTGRAFVAAAGPGIAEPFFELLRSVGAHTV